MTWSSPSPRLARTLIVVGMRAHAQECPVCRVGANVTREEGKDAGHRIINHCAVALKFRAAWRRTKTLETVGALPMREIG